MSPAFAGDDFDEAPSADAEKNGAEKSMRKQTMSRMWTATDLVDVWFLVNMAMAGCMRALDDA